MPSNGTLKRLANAEPTVTPTDDGLLFHGGLVCYVGSIHYDFVQRIGLIRMGGERSSPDMGGAIALFLAVDPRVRQVQAANALGFLDIVYTRDSHDQWHASDYRRANPPVKAPGTQRATA